MRIELNAGGLGGLATVAAFGGDYAKMLGKTRDVISSFKGVRSRTTGMNGGVGNLQGALDAVDRRIKSEEQKVEKMTAVGKKFADFLVKAAATDAKVAVKVLINKEEFYRVCPWSRPQSAWDRFVHGLKDAWNWLCEKGKEFIEAVEHVAKAIGEGLKWVVDTIGKGIKAIGDFCKRHWKAIVKLVIGGLVIAALGALTVLTGGAAAGLLGAVCAGAFHTAIITAITTGVVKGIQGAIHNGGNNPDGIFGAFFDGFGDGFMTGSIKGACKGAAGAVAPYLFSVGKISSGGAKVLDAAMGGLGKATGGLFSKCAGYKCDGERISDHAGELGKDFLWDLATGTVEKGVENKMAEKKLDAYQKIQNRIKNGNASKLDNFIANSKFTNKDYTSTLKDGVWTQGKDAAKATINKLTDEGKNNLKHLFHESIKDGFKKVVPKVYENGLKIISNDEFDFKMPTLTNIIDTTVGNLFDGIKDPVISGIGSGLPIIPWKPPIIRPVLPINIDINIRITTGPRAAVF